MIAMTSTTDGTPALRLRGIDMHYGFVRALDQIDFHVMNGKSWRSSATTAPASPRC
jgi:hypothetical protein